MQDSILLIENKLINTYVPINIKRIDRDTLILFSKSTNYKEIYIHKSYSDSSKILKINSIEYFSSVCFGKCPSIKVTIMNDRTFIYEGISDVEFTGFYKGKVPEVYFDDIWNKIKLLNILDLNKEYNNYLTDVPRHVIKINYDDNKSKEIKSYGGAGTTELKWLLNTLYNFEYKVNLEND